MNALEYFKQGYSCSESIVKEAIDLGWCSEDLLSSATAFSGGMSSGCACGTVTGSQLVIGSLFGKGNKFENEVIAKAVAKEFVDRFKKQHGVTCCRVLTKGFEMHSPERKEHCKNFVMFSSELLKEIVKSKLESKHVQNI